MLVAMSKRDRLGWLLALALILIGLAIVGVMWLFVR